MKHGGNGRPNRLRRLWRWLIEPSPTITDADDRRRARVLAAMLLPYSLTILLVLLFQLVSEAAPPATVLRENPDLYVAAGVLFFFTAAYFLNRRGHYLSAALLTIATSSVGVFGILWLLLTGRNPTYARTDLGALVYLVIPVLFAGVLLPFRLIFFVAAINLLVVLLLPYFFPLVTWSLLFSEPLGFVVIVYFLVALAVYHRQQIETEWKSELIEKEARYRSLLETTFEGIVIVEEGRLIEANVGFVRMFGYSLPEVIGRPLLDFIARESHFVTEGNVEAGIERPREIFGVRRDTTRFPIELVAKAHTYQGRPVRVVAIRDITQRMRAQSTLRELESIINRSSAVVVLWHVVDDWGIKFVSDTIRQIGYTPEELYTGRIHLYEIIHPQDLGPFMHRIARLSCAGREHLIEECRVLTKDGEVRWIENHVWIRRDAEDRITHYQVIALDVTERKQAEEEARRRAVYQDALNGIISAAAAPNLSNLLETTLDRVLQALQLEMGVIWMAGQSAMRGAALEDVVGSFSTGSPPQLEDEDCIVVEERRFVEDGVHGALLHGLGVRAYLAAPVFDEGQCVGVVSVADVQPRQWTQEEVGLVQAASRQLSQVARRFRLQVQIEEQTRRVRQIIETVPEGMLLLDAQRRVLHANPIGREYLEVLADGEVGAELSDLGGQPIDRFLDPPQEGTGHELELEGPVRRIFEVVVRPTEAPSGPPGWVMILRDVTREREIQQRIQQQERLAVVGQMAAGIAHDFNNIMAAIVLYGDMLGRSPSLTSRDRERLETIVQQAERAADLIRQILDFSRSSVIERRPLNLTPFIKELIRLMRRTLPENIELHLEHDTQDCVVHADPGRIQQAVMNLALNARDAMPEGGRLELALRRVSIHPDADPPLPEMEPGTWVELVVSDTGVGIPPEVQTHIFEPFFTTKPVNEGAGLGLAQVYGIVKQHDGYIHVESRVGQGARFTLYLPALAISSTVAEEEENTAPIQGEGETILVVEDDAPTRRAIVDILRALNYRVLAACDGREALLLFAEQDACIDLVLSDLVMPGIGGLGLFEVLRQHNPSIRIVAFTGYPLTEDALGTFERGIVDWLRKPVSMGRLAHVVHRALHAERSV
jgi:PAS domain S-box-containing protein